MTQTPNPPPSPTDPSFATINTICGKLATSGDCESAAAVGALWQEVERLRHCKMVDPVQQPTRHDIVARLRDMAARYPEAQLERDAADEIERLRSLVAREREECAVVAEFWGAPDVAARIRAGERRTANAE